MLYTVFPRINAAAFINSAGCGGEGGVYSGAAFINLATRFMSNSDFLDAPLQRAYAS